MKKILVVLAALMLTIGAQAQEQRQGGQGGQRRDFNPEQQATRRVDRIKKACTDLTDEQGKKLYDLYLAEATQMKAQRDSMMQKMQEGQQGERPKFDREAMKKRNEEMDAKVKAILTEEQYTQYQKAEEERRQRGPQGGGQGGPRRGEGGPQGRPEGGQQ